MLPRDYSDIEVEAEIVLDQLRHDDLETDEILVDNFSYIFFCE